MRNDDIHGVIEVEVVNRTVSLDSHRRVRARDWDMTVEGLRRSWYDADELKATDADLGRLID